jgi:hypothetical protein
MSEKVRTTELIHIELTMRRMTRAQLLTIHDWATDMMAEIDKSEEGSQ